MKTNNSITLTNFSCVNLFCARTSLLYTQSLLSSAKMPNLTFKSGTFPLRLLVALPELNTRILESGGLLPVFFPTKTLQYSRFNRCVTSYFPGMFTLIQQSKELTITLGVKIRYLLFMCTFLKYSWRFRMSTLIDVWASDFISRLRRFEIAYCLVSVFRNERIYIRVFTDELTPVPSISRLFNSAGWLEREVWDMYGVMFSGHSDLRRILTDYGFLGFPLRKDFPLTGFFEIRYDDTQRQIVAEPVNLIQELRLFFFSTVWVKL